MRSRPAAGDDSDQYDEGDERLERGAQCLGVDLETLDAAQLPVAGSEQPELLAEHDPDVCEVLPENWEALLLYLRCKQQFKLSLGMAGGFWSACEACNVRQELDWMGIKPKQQAEVVDRYRVIEAEALRLMNQKLSEKS